MISAVHNLAGEDEVAALLILATVTSSDVSPGTGGATVEILETAVDSIPHETGTHP